VILAESPALEVDPSAIASRSAAPAAPPTTLEAAEREAIVRALEGTHWRIGGASGAAARLGMKRTTLQSRIRKLGIERPCA